MMLRINAERLIRLPAVESNFNYLQGFWTWVELLAEADYAGALESLYWPDGKSSFTPELLEERITTFWVGEEPWSVAVPNERLVSVINDRALFRHRWLTAQVPVTTRPEDPKDDGIPLMGVVNSFLVDEIIHV